MSAVKISTNDKLFRGGWQVSDTQWRMIDISDVNVINLNGRLFCMIALCGFVL